MLYHVQEPVVEFILMVDDAVLDEVGMEVLSLRTLELYGAMLDVL